MSGFVEAAVIGGIFGAGTAAATGRDPKKGAGRGAIAGPIAGAVAGPGLSAGATGVGGAIAGATAKRKGLGKISTAMGRDPAAKTVLAGERAESIADKLKKRKRYKTVMGGYGDLSLGKAGLLGV